jgi:hypothetical protein
MTDAAVPSLLQSDILEPGFYTRSILDLGIGGRARREFLVRFLASDLPLTKQKAHENAVRMVQLEPGLLTDDGATHPQDKTLFVDKLTGRRIGPREVLVTATYRTLPLGGFGGIFQTSPLFHRRPVREGTVVYRTFEPLSGGEEDYAADPETALPSGLFNGVVENADDPKDTPSRWTWMRPVERYIFERTFPFDPVAQYDLRRYESSINSAAGPGGPAEESLRYDGADVTQVNTTGSVFGEYRCRFTFTQVSLGKWYSQRLWLDAPDVGPPLWRTTNFRLYPLDTEVGETFALAFAFLGIP